jgi:hypothetical protein
MAFVLVASSLTLRRLPKGSLIKLVLIWVLIFAGMWVLVIAVSRVVG